MGYDAIQLIATAAEEAGSIDPADIDAALAELPTVEGPRARSRSRARTGSRPRSITLVKVENGKFALRRQVHPRERPGGRWLSAASRFRVLAAEQGIPLVSSRPRRGSLILPRRSGVQLTAAMSTDEVLTVDSVTAGYGPTVALRSVSLEVREGEIVSLVGADRCRQVDIDGDDHGPSPSTDGSIRYRQEEIHGMEPEEIVKLGIALVPERRRIFPGLTVRDNLRLGAATSRSDTGAGLDAAFELFPILRERMDQQAGLPVGWRGAAAGDRTRSRQPAKLILLDEPTLGLAPMIADGVFELLIELRDKHGVTVLLVEQNALGALEIADRGYVLSTGKVVQSGSARDLLEDPALLESYLGVRQAGPAWLTSSRSS